ncbi:putative ABC transport system ATP-binding protein [Nonomuraea polychroma]|uniref:Putative ABC transport system ATP-binding protein n=1 Tax=Nonomuraea polychroma TaxID=46176 RepID=A0A438MAB6_9ACTN|nr:putative ABC transport system ATP-binding protein [Nonomuraea polychroma]
MSPIVHLENVVKTYGNGTTALRGVDLKIFTGELLAIVGPSGSGKSTLLHIMGLLDRPTSGRVSLAGQDVAQLPDRELSRLRASLIGFVFQQFHLAVGVSALDNVADGMLYSGVPLSERRRRAAWALERVGLGDRLSHRPHELSGGEQQRVAVARAVVKEPAVLYADEPTGNLDSASGSEVLDVLRTLHRDGTTVAIITHEHEVADAAERQVGIRDGRVVTDVRRGT